MERVREAGVSAQAWQARVAAALIALALLAAAPAGAAAEPSGEVYKVAQDAADVRAYWTPERMRNAKPAGPLTELGDAARSSGGEAAKGDTIANRVRRPGKKPRRSHGKVFLTLGGVNYVCSGTVVRAPAQNVVWTAGHCVYDQVGLTARYASNWMFVPAYRNGKRRLGEWTATALAATPQWRNCDVLAGCDNFDHDFGAANVRGPGGKTIQQVTRGRRIEFNGPRDRTYRVFGYPVTGAFEGEKRPYRCRSPFMGNDPGSPPPMRIRCDMTGGSSGGGWVVGGAVASVISYGYPRDPNSLYGPYQGASAQNLYDQVRNG